MINPLELAELFGIATIAGFVDTLAGGGGLITLPSLLLFGIAPLPALAINKVQSSFGSGAASLSLVRHGLLDPRRYWRAAFAAFAGAASGALIISHLNARTLDGIIPLVLVVICAYVLFAPQMGSIAQAPRVAESIYRYCIVPLIGIYDGCFGPGTGSFFAISAIALRGILIIEATAQAKLLNFATNIAAALIFIMSGNVRWTIALSMGIGQMLGAILAGRVLSRGHTGLIRPLIVIVSIGMIARYAIQHFSR